MSSELGFAPDFEKQTKQSRMTPESLEAFVNHNKIAIMETNIRSRCVDGRYNEYSDEEFPMIAKPGASSDDVIAAFGALNLLSKSLPHQTVLNAVIEVEGGLDKFIFHTDHHTESQEGGYGMGCGHMKKAWLDPKTYAVTRGQIDYLFTRLPELLQQSAKQVVLQGDHAESAVVIVESEYFGLKPMRKINDEVQQVFVYHKTLHERQLNLLACNLQAALAETGEVVEESTIRQALDQVCALQMDATLTDLAKGLPVFSVKMTLDHTQIISL